jgi:beta-1,4-mannosyl-glycoprotein beta-1,4-N-acetylglucosaminyltransferase
MVKPDCLNMLDESECQVIEQLSQNIYDVKLMETLKVDYKLNTSELCEIGKKYDTDKSSQRSNVTDNRHCHPYTLFYDGLFRDKKDHPLEIAELGILDGASLLMWQQYFSKSNIYGFEYNLKLIDEFKNNQNNERVSLSHIDVTNKKSVFNAFSNANIMYDVIIEDTTHQFEDQIRVIENAYQYLKPGGVLIIEDIFKHYKEVDYISRLTPILKYFQDYYFIELDHKNKNSTGWDNDKLFILVRGGAKPIFINKNKVTIITPSYRTDNLLTVQKSIDFDYVDEWIIVYDGNKITENPHIFKNHNKIKEYVYKGYGISGNPQRNYALTKITNKDTFLYYLDDDNIIHPNLYKLISMMDKNKMYTFNQGDREKGNNIKVGRIDTAMCIIHYKLCNNITWIANEYTADGHYIKECYDKNKDSHIYVNNDLCYYNKIEELHKSSYIHKSKTVCLNMIVKNESHIIESTLKNILQNMQIDYWVISDTGSTDNTMDIIRDFFAKKNIDGEIFQDEWVDFGHNRTKALEHARNKSDYLFIFDADDLIHGKIILPTEFDKDLYDLPFENPTSYHRSILISNRMRWKYRGVLHEILGNIDPINSRSCLSGNFYVESRRLGDRSKNPNKYMDDAIILENAYNNENTDTDIKCRYSFFCGTSYRLAGKPMKAIEHFKNTIVTHFSPQYKYCACIQIGDCYNNLKQYDNAIKYWSKSYNYDNERLEGIVNIMEHYYNKNAHFMVSALYNKFKHVTIGRAEDKIYLEHSKYHHMHYLASISGCYCNEHKSAYEATKYLLLNSSIGIWYMAGTIFNLQFYMTHFKQDKDKQQLVRFFVGYIQDKQRTTEQREFAWNLTKDIIKQECPNEYGVVEQSILLKKNIDKSMKYSSSNKILIYTGWMTHLWNASHLETDALGGSEKAVAYLAREFPKNYEIIVSGDVEDGIFDNVAYIHQNKLQSILDSTHFHTVIISRNICFLNDFHNIKCSQLVLSLHDTHILNGTFAAQPVMKMYEDEIDKVITLTNWHKSNITYLYPMINTDKIEVINNGIDVSRFVNSNMPNKIPNKFMWSSRTERGLHILLILWKKLLENIPDATLDICSYGNFPQNDNDRKMLKIIDMHESITYHGKLNVTELYNLMAKSEYWLYTNTFPETSCITAMEMLMSEVICIYYPLAGLVDTIGDYGITVRQGEEIKTLLDLTTEKKELMKSRGKEYALTCSWKNRAKQWSSMLELNKDKWVFYCSPHFEKRMIQQYIDNMNNIYPAYCIYLSSDRAHILDSSPKKITFVYEVFDSNIVTELPNTHFSFLNTEPLNIPARLDSVKNILKMHPGYDYYDYSESNLKILEENGIVARNNTYLPYKCSKNELAILTDLNKNTTKEYDFGILKTAGDTITDRRLKFVNFLKENNFTVNIIGGWSNDRDVELAKCKIIINIHGNLNNNVSYIFEHIRCDRLLKAGFNILSENNHYLSVQFIKNYPNLQLIHYEDLFDIGTIIDSYNNRLSSINHSKKVLDILKVAHATSIFQQDHITFIENLSKEMNYDNITIYDIGSSVLHWTQIASNIWKNSKIYAFDAMTEMKLFYDDYNNNNDLNYEYNIGVLCDEDYKRISFYQNDELPGGNSYYKEIGHPESHNIFTESHIKHKIGMTLETVVKNKNIPFPDLIKIDVQGAEFDILKGSMNIINHAKFLIVELQHTQYNKDAPLCNITRDFLLENGWEVFSEKFCNNGPDADWCFINTSRAVSYNTHKINDIMNRKNVCFIHSCHLKNKGVKRLDYLITKIKTSGLIDRLDAIYINNIGIPIEENNYGDKFDICNYSDNSKLYEIPTINKIKQYSADNPNTNILYLHTKGISYDDANIKENNWIDMMLYFMVEQSELCVEKMNNGTQAIGCNYYDEKMNVRSPSHFSGNFWWADSSYINTLSYLDEKNENVNPTDAEFWLCQNNPTIYEPHNSRINHYHSIYPTNKYHITEDCEPTSEILINNLHKYSSAWLGHMEFACWLVKLLKPKIVVDLGVDFGHSTFSFAAAKEGVIYGIDSFAGDVQAGFKNTFDIVHNFKNNMIKQELLIDNITFIKGYFDDVYNTFDKVIDILHIDGLHTYESVSNDYNKWVSKTSDDAIILFHDVMSYPDTVGVVFNNISYPKFYFTHSAGLGVVCKNATILNNILSSCNLPNTECIKMCNKKIIDCFIFYNELDLLNYRLNILNDVVDYFVLVESRHTFVGKEKPLFYQDNKELFAEFNHKIIHIVVDDFPHKFPYIDIGKGEQWVNEKFQRNCISRGIDKLHLQDNDVITITDLDEIPNPKILEQIKNNEIVVDINIIELDFYYYNLHSKMDHKWHHSKILTFRKYTELNITCDAIRFYNCPVIENAGWHLSYFGDGKFIKNKLENFSHQEYNKPQFVDEKQIELRIKNSKDLFDRDCDIIHIDIEDNDNLPPEYDIYLTNFYKKIQKVI